MTERLQHPHPRPNDVRWAQPFEPKLPKGRTKGEQAIVARTAKVILAAFSDLLDEVHNANCIAFKVGGGLTPLISLELSKPKGKPHTAEATFGGRGYLIARLKTKDSRFHKKP